MVTLFESLAAGMDELVDETLGDTIEYRRAGGAWTEITGFILDVNASIDTLDPLDELDQRKRLKVQFATIAAPVPTDRVRAARLGAGVFAPSANFDIDGRYWVADVQRAST